MTNLISFTLSKHNIIIGSSTISIQTLIDLLKILPIKLKNINFVSYIKNYNNIFELSHNPFDQ